MNGWREIVREGTSSRREEEHVRKEVKFKREGRRKEVDGRKGEGERNERKKEEEGRRGNRRMIEKRKHEGGRK